MLEQKRSESMSSSADKESVSGSGDLSTACQKYGNSESTDSPTRQSAYSSSSDNEEDLIGWKDSAESWMEKWWNERPCNRTGKYHNRFVGHRKRGIVKYVNPGKSVDPSEKFKQSVFCQNVSLAEFTSSVREHNRIYTAVLNAPTGIGLNLTLTESGEVLVQGLNCLKSGLPSPAQMSGLIKVGDRLIGVNNSNFVDATHEEIVSILRGLDSLAKREALHLRFMYDEEFDHKHDRSDCIVDTSIVSNQFQHSKDTAYKGSTDDFLISIGGAFPVVNLLANFLAGTETSGESKPLEQITEKVVRKADGSGAALQSVQYSSTSTMNRERIGTDLYRNKSFLEETQRMIRKKHLYPAVARVNNQSYVGSNEEILSVLADEVFEWRPYYLPQLYLGFYQLPSLSIFIQSEKDTGIYKYTEYLEWDPQQNAYVGETQHALEQRRKAIRRYSDRVVGGKNKTSNVQFSRKQEISCLQSAVSSWEDTSVAADSDIDVSKINTLKFDKVVSELIRNKNQRKLQKKTYVPTRHSLIQRKDNLTPIKSVAIKATDSRKYESSISLDARQTQICGTINDEEWMHSDVNNRSTPGCENLVTPKKLKGLGLNVQQQIANAHKYGYFVDTEQILSEISSLNTEGIIRDLSLSIEEYFDCGYDSPSSTTTCGTPGKHDHPRYLETGIEISFPPFPVTYRIIFGLIALRRVVLIPWYTKNIVDVLERWMTLFDHKRLVRGVRGRSKRSREANEFFVYYRNNVATAVDMSGYLAIVSELITLLFILKVCPENAKVAKTQEISGTYIYGTDSNSKFKLIDKVVKENCSLRLIPIALDFQQGERFQEIRFNEEEASNFVREFQSLLIPDIAIVAASFRMFKTTTATILQAISKDDRYCDAVAQISQLIHSSDTKTLSSARHFLVRLYDMSYDAIYSVICVCVSQLGTLFKKNELLAINVCLMLFPLIHPWNVQLALFGSSELTVSDKDEATNGSEVQAFNTWKSSAYLKFYNYLTKLMKAEESLVGQSCDTIHSFLHTALYLHHSIATEEGFQQVTHNMDRPQSLPNLEPKVSFNHAAEMRSQQRYSIAVSNRQHPNLMSSQGYLSSAKRLLKTSEKYLYNPLYSARECVKYDYFEGVVLAIDKWLTESINSNCNLRNHVVHSDLTEIFDTLGAATRALLKDWTTYANNTHVELTSWKNESIFHSMLTCAWIVCAAAAKSTEENLDSNYLPSTVRKFTTWLDPLLSEVEECIQAIVEKEGYEVLDHFAIAVVDSLATVLGKHLGSRSKTEELSFFKTRIRPSNDVELTKECVNGLLDGIPVVADHLSMIFFRHIAPWYQ